MLTRTFLRTLATAALATVLMGIPARGMAQQVTDWNDPTDTLENAVGLHYGILGGNGLAFRLPISWYFYFQVAGGIWHTSDNKQHNIGFEFNYLLRQDQRWRVYLAAGTGYFYDDEQVQPDVWQTESHWNYGAGVGLEYLFGRRWAAQFEGDFAYHGDSSDITVVPQLGIYYYW